MRTAKLVSTAIGWFCMIWLAVEKALKERDATNWFDKLELLSKTDTDQSKEKIGQIADVILERGCSADQMQSLERLIWYSNDASPLAKKVAIWLLRESKNLTRNVYASFSAEEGSFDILMSFHEMVSTNKTTHLNRICRLLKPHLTFSSHSGMFHSSSPKQVEGGRVWLSTKGHYDKDAEFIEHDMEVIQAIQHS